MNNKNDKKKKHEYEKNPFSNLKDSFDRAEVGDLRPLSQLGCLPTIIFIIIGFLIFFILTR
ncbi:DUF6366 family protein [Effusibacillus lacus]|uniref:Uncharacterized protein n=1 Tax=Effusibacillus lacus TaxID=1348429 RepID=A0A292YQS9_9BACL|nr:hypothetical protein EFBL_2482 [Effusibacillus lacus]